MTKKSSSRIERDAKAKMVADARNNGVGKRSPAERLMAKKQFNNRTNTCWDDAMQSASAVRESLLEVASLCKQHFGDRAVMAFLEDQKSTAERASVIKSDLEDLTTRFTSTFEKHSTKKGGSNDADEVMQSLQINESYAAIIDELGQVVLPMVGELAKDFEAASSRATSYVETVSDIAKAQGVVLEGAEELTTEISSARAEQTVGKVEFVLEDEAQKFVEEKSQA